MAGSALLAVQTAVYAKLAADATLVALLSGAVLPGDPRIYDAPKENQPFPYLILGDGGERKDDTMGRCRKAVEVKLTAWSRYQGFLQVENIAARVAALLDGGTLSIASYTHERCVHDRTDVGRLQDGVTRWAQIAFSVRVTEA